MIQQQDELLLKRRHFPLFGKVNTFFDVKKVRDELDYIEGINGWNDMTPESPLVKDLINGRERLTAKFQNDDGSYSSYHQILLTEFSTKAEGTIAPIDLAKKAEDKLSTYRQDAQRALPELDEKNYNQPRSFIQGTPEIKKILNHFGDRLMRARFARISPRFSIKPHIDYDTTYGIRLHLAVNTNEQCFVWARRNKNKGFEKFHIPADGNLYFVNAGFEHFASNDGTEDRTHLVLSVFGQQDIRSLASTSF